MPSVPMKFKWSSTSTDRSENIADIYDEENTNTYIICKSDSICPKPTDKEIEKYINSNFTKFIYFDNNATHPILPSVKERIVELMDKIGNPSSLHEAGRVTRAFVEYSRDIFSTILHLSKDNLLFTASGTESNNLCIKGYVFNKLYKKDDSNKHIIVSSIEHKSILNTVESLKIFGYEIDYVRPNKDTHKIEAEDVIKLIRPTTGLISIMSVNNETGLITDIPAIVKRIKEINNNILVHSDLSQHLGKTELFDFNCLDFATFTTHKFGGPVGVSILYVKNLQTITSILDGGAQEFNLRPGTYNAPLIAGAGRAVAELKNIDFTTIKELRNEMEIELEKRGFKINFKDGNRVCSTISILWPYESEKVLEYMSKNGIFFSSQSACSSAIKKASYVLTECGLTEEEAFRTTRISLNRFNTREETQYFFNILDKMVI